MNYDSDMAASTALGCSFIYWNCRGALNKKPEIEKMAESHDVIILAETCLIPLHDFRIRGFECFKNDFTKPGMRGLTVLVKNSIVFSILDLTGLLDQSMEAIALRLFTRQGEFAVVGAYRHPNVSTSSRSIRNLFNLISSFKLSLILGDFNPHHSLWGAQTHNVTGNIIADFLDNYNMILLNPNTPTFFLILHAFPH